MYFSDEETPGTQFSLHDETEEEMLRRAIAMSLEEGPAFKVEVRKEGLFFTKNRNTSTTCPDPVQLYCLSPISGCRLFMALLFVIFSYLYKMNSLVSKDLS